MRPLLLLFALACVDAPPETDTDTGDNVEDSDVVVLPLRDISATSRLTHRQFVLTDDWLPTCQALEVHGGGAAVGDIDGDGIHDLFFTVHDGPSRLYKGVAGGSFLDVTAASGLDIQGWPMGATLGDLDGDHDLDLIVTYARDRLVSLHLNQGDGTFVDAGPERGLVAPDVGAPLGCTLGWSASLGDPDLDGDLDVYIASWPRDIDTPPITSQFYENDGSAKFTNRTEALGLYVRYTESFTPLWGDVTGDGRPDLAVCSDFLTNRLYLQGEDGAFSATNEGIGDVENGMGGWLADIDEDGDLDWFVTSIWDPRDPQERLWGGSGNRLYLNDGAGGFTDGSDALGLRETGWAWGTAAFDLENDGDLDIGVTNGHWSTPGAAYLVEPFFEDRTALFVRGPGRTPFVDEAVELGLDETGQGRGFLPFDLEGDGDLDVLIVRWADTPVLYRNDLDVGHWLDVRIDWDGPNTDGVGAWVTVQRTPTDPPRRREIHANSTYLSQGPISAHFGLGDHDGPLHEVVVHWPYGEDIVLTDVAPDQVLVVTPP